MNNQRRCKWCGRWMSKWHKEANFYLCPNCFAEPAGMSTNDDYRREAHRDRLEKYFAWVGTGLLCTIAWLSILWYAFSYFGRH